MERGEREFTLIWILDVSRVKFTYIKFKTSPINTSQQRSNRSDLAMIETYRDVMLNQGSLVHYVAKN